MDRHIIKIHIEFTNNKVQIKIIVYLGASVFLIDCARDFLAGWVSSPADVPVLAA
jgi:hypothetical protein